MYVCVCAAVTEGQVGSCIRQGARTMTDLRCRLGLKQCGKCSKMVREILLVERRCEGSSQGDPPAAE
jgi:bacterioferritin-associated ferredoxin